MSLAVGNVSSALNAGSANMTAKSKRAARVVSHKYLVTIFTSHHRLRFTGPRYAELFSLRTTNRASVIFIYRRPDNLSIAVRLKIVEENDLTLGGPGYCSSSAVPDAAT